MHAFAPLMATSNKRNKSTNKKKFASREDLEAVEMVSQEDALEEYLVQKVFI